MAEAVETSTISSPEINVEKPVLQHSSNKDKNLEPQVQLSSEELSNSYLTGWRLGLTTVSVLLCLYLVNIEVTIVSTSLVTITNELHGFDKASWVVTGYLITYTGFIIIWSKLSDVIGRKSAITATMIVFVAFSAGCGAANTLNQLIIFRAFQGIGAAGAYSMSILTVYDMVAKEKLALYGALISVTIAIATLTGPIFGGLLARGSSWRWIFYLNIPVGAIAIALLLVAMPGNFGSNSAAKLGLRHLLSGSSLRRLDFVGSALLLAGSLLLVTALVEASVSYAWSSSLIIAFLVLSAISWIVFFIWEWYISKKDGKQEPIFPWRFFYNRAWIGMLITTFLVGIPFNVVTIALPQRFQTVSGVSPLGSGIRLIPYSTVAAVFSALANIASSKGKIPPIYLLLFGGVLHVIGLALLSTLPLSAHFPAAGYGYQALAGAGVGTTIGILILTTPFMVEQRDIAVATGAIIQFRFLGGAIGLAIVSSVLNSMLQSNLDRVLSPIELETLLDTAEIISALSLEKQAIVRAVFARSYNVQFRIMTGFAAAQIPVAMLLWRKGGQFRTA